VKNYSIFNNFPVNNNVKLPVSGTFFVYSRHLGGLYGSQVTNSNAPEEREFSCRVLSVFYRLVGNHI
jgi:hypothetical protein